MFQTQYNFSFDAEKHAEKVKDKVSITSPDMSFTVRELLAKFTSGQPVPVGQQGTFEENPSFDHIDPLSGDYDLTDITELQIELDYLKNNISKAQKAIDAKKAEEAKTTEEEV